MLLKDNQLTDNFLPDGTRNIYVDMPGGESNSDFEVIYTSEDSSDDETDRIFLLHSDDSSVSSTTTEEEATVLNDVIKLDENEEEDTTVKAIIKSKELQRTHPPPISLDDFVIDICFHPKIDMIAVGNIVGDVLLFKYTNEETELLSTVELHRKSCRDIEFDQDGKILYSAGKDLSIMVTDVETRQLVRLYENAHEDPIFKMTILDENTFATGDDDGVVKLWDTRQGSITPIFSIKKMEDFVSGMITNTDNKYLVCSSGDGSLTTINMPARKLHIQSEEYGEELLCLGLFKSERKILTASSRGKMFVFNWGEFGYHSDEFPSFTKKPINCMIPITENIVITGGEDGILRATSLFPYNQLGVVGQHNFPIEALDVNKDGTLIASSSHSDDIKFWNVEYLETLNTYERIKGGKQKEMTHNLPSSSFNNACDFFAEL